MSFNGIGALRSPQALSRACRYCGRVYHLPGNCQGCGAPPKACFVPQAKPIKKGVNK